MSLITQGKTNWKFLLIIIILAIIVGAGALWYAKRAEQPYQPIEIKKPETSKSLTPQEIVKAWFENQKKGEWQTVFANMVDVDGKPYSQECQDGFKKAFGANVGAEYTLDIKNDLKIGSCKDLPELNLLAQSFGFQLPDGQCANVSLSYATKSSGKVEDTFLILFKVNNDWKVMMYCKPLLSVEEPTTKVEKPTPKDETADWKTFKNERNKFEIKYPKNLTVESIEPTTPPDFYEFKHIGISITVGGMNWETANGVIEQAIDGKSESVSISGFTGIKREGKFIEGGFEVEMVILEGPKKTVFQFFTVKENEKTFDQMLSTFRFLD